MDFELYLAHVAKATAPLDRFKEEKLLQDAGQADWALKLRAWLLGRFHQHFMPLFQDTVDPQALFSALEDAKNNCLYLDECQRREYMQLHCIKSPHPRAVAIGVEGVT